MGQSPPASAAGALTVLVSRLRSAVGADVIRGRSGLAAVLPEPAQVDVEDVEPFAADTVAGNLNPVGRLYYSFSTFLCVPHAINEGAQDALGNQAGEQPIAQIIAEAGFGHFARVAQTPFNIVYAARP